MTIKLPKTPIEFTCSTCNYVSSNKKDYTKHLLTTKHDRLTNADYIPPKKLSQHGCDCGKIYKQRQGLFKHRKVCKTYTIEPPTPEPTTQGQQVDISVVLELLKQNQEFKNLIVEERREFQDMMIEQNKQMTELAKNAGNNNNNTNNTTNNKFNLNVFLNETCKDAITMDDFIQSIEVSMEDFINTGKLGFVDGISKVMLERMKDMEMHTRPLHCTDLKRETMYIKNEDKWEKDDTDKTTLRKAVKNVAKKNYRQLKPWFDSSQPRVEQLGTDECENYFKYYKAALGGYGKEEDILFENKIMRNVLKEVIVDKDTVATR